MVDIDFTKLLMAEREADKRIEEAHRKADEMLRQAREEAKRIFEEKSKVDEKGIIDEVRRELFKEYESFQTELSSQFADFKKHVEENRENIIREIVSYTLGVHK
ncbi:MAG: hypothetical protein DRJ64_07495 [Thermoprotei archaeon]|nr:MAG: hypothetical protein DRJ64_07495 [Thermoprotei archaeon]